MSLDGLVCGGGLKERTGRQRASAADTGLGGWKRTTDNASKCASAGKEAPCPFKIRNYEEAGDYLEARVHLFPSLSMNCW